jgi:bacterioferritin
MRGDPAVIEVLNDVLTAELTAINQYFIHHKMCENWGYQTPLEEEVRGVDRRDEGRRRRDRAHPLSRRRAQHAAHESVRVGEDAIEQHRLDLALETEAIERSTPASRCAARRATTARASCSCRS